MAPKAKGKDVRQEDYDAANDEANASSKEDIEKMKERSCTDCPCCLVFLAFIVTIVGLGAYGIASGEPSKLATPFDQDGNECGAPVTDGGNTIDMSEYPYKWVYGIFAIPSDPSSVDVSQINIYAAVCVKECPAFNEQSDCYYLDGTNLAGAGTNMNTVPYGEHDDCPSSAFATNLDMIDTYCLPDYEEGKDGIIAMFKDLGESDSASKYIVDIANSWQTLLIMVFVTVIIAVLYIWLLKYIVKPLLWASMILVVAMFIALGAYAYQQKNEFDTEDPNYQYCQIGAIVCFVLAGVFVCCILCCWNNIMLGAALMEAASEFVGSNPRIVATPLVAYFFSLIFFLWWIITAAFLYSLGTVTRPGSPNINILPNLELDDQTFGIMWYYLFALFWITAFLMSLQKFIIASAASLWYWDAVDDGSRDFSVCTAMTWGLWYHCGTVAFGSFLIAVVQLIRAIFEYMVKKANESGADNAAKRAVECVIRCCLWCLDQCVKFITENAYIQCAVSNKSFCPAAWSAFCLIIRNAGRFGSLSMVDWMLMVLGKGFIVAASVLLTYVIADKGFPLIQQPVIPAVFILAYSYVVASLFLTIFSFAARTILHNFLLDEEVSGGNPNTPSSLQPFLDYCPEPEDEGEAPAKNQTGTKADDMKVENMD